VSRAEEAKEASFWRPMSQKERREVCWLESNRFGAHLFTFAAAKGRDFGGAQLQDAAGKSNCFGWNS